MAEIMFAADLEVGDLYRGVFGTFAPEVRGDAYVVNAIRTVTYLETYRVIEATNTRTGLAAQINLRNDVQVAKLEPTPHRDVVGLLPYLESGEQLTVTYFQQQFWT